MELLRDKYKSPLPQHLRWSSWATDDEGITGDALLDFVNNTLLPKLKALTGGGDKITTLIRSAFEDANSAGRGEGGVVSLGCMRCGAVAPARRPEPASLGACAPPLPHAACKER